MITTTIYEAEIARFLKSLQISEDDIKKIWREERTFPAPDKLLPLIVKYRSPSPKAKDILLEYAAFFSKRDETTSSFPRMDFMLGLADLYAKEFDKDTYIVEFDINNCHGAGKWLGFERMISIFKLVNEQFLSSLKEHGADFCFSFDSAKNDDFKIIVGGIKKNKLEKALKEAQTTLDNLLVFAVDLPHSKHDDMRGLGVGYSFQQLGCGLTIEEIEQLLETAQEQSKTASFQNRQETLAKHPKRQPIPTEVSYLLADEALKKKTSEATLLSSKVKKALSIQKAYNQAYLPADPNQARQIKWLKSGLKSSFSSHDRAILSDIASFYHQRDGLTGALNSQFLLHDLKHISEKKAHPVTVINFKLENCAGVNKILSRRYSVAMTRDLVSKIERFLNTDTAGGHGAWVYYTGRNSFNILLANQIDKESVLLLENRLNKLIDTEVNQKSIKDYFSELGIALPIGSDCANQKMSDIPNLRGRRSGIQIIDYTSANFSNTATQADLDLFQATASNLPQGIRRNFNIASVRSELFDDAQIPNINALYRKLILKRN